MHDNPTKEYHKLREDLVQVYNNNLRGVAFYAKQFQHKAGDLAASDVPLLTAYGMYDELNQDGFAEFADYYRADIVDLPALEAEIVRIRLVLENIIYRMEQVESYSNEKRFFKGECLPCLPTPPRVIPPKIPSQTPPRKPHIDKRESKRQNW